MSYTIANVDSIAMFALQGNHVYVTSLQAKKAMYTYLWADDFHARLHARSLHHTATMCFILHATLNKIWYKKILPQLARLEACNAEPIVICASCRSSANRVNHLNILYGKQHLNSCQ
jgi:hypothetical protein